MNRASADDGNERGPAAVLGTAVVDDDLTVTRCSDDVAEAFDVDPEDVVGRPLSALVDPAAVGLAQAGLTGAPDGRTSTDDTDHSTDDTDHSTDDTDHSTDDDTADDDTDADGPTAVLDRDGRTCEVRAVPFVDADGRRHGHTLVVTERRRHERELRRQREEPSLLPRLNRVVRDVNQVLLTAGTRTELLDGAADRLADSPLYDAAWAVEETLADRLSDAGAAADAAVDARDAEPRVEGGTDDPHVEAASPGDAGRERPDAAGTVVEGSLADGRRALGVDEAAPSADDVDGLADDVEGLWTTVPVMYGQTAYGSVVLFSTREDAFGERELAVLDELGRQVGHAINAADKELLLVSDSVIELELAATGDDPLAAASRAAGCTLAVEGLVPAGGNELLAYCAVEGTSVHEALAALSKVDGIVSLRPVDDRVIECRLGEGTLANPLREVGAQLEEVVAEAGTATVVARVAPDADVRAVVERVRQSVPSAELRAKRRREGTTDAGSRAAAARGGGLVEELTEKQRETLETAYDAGYFDWPRESTAEDVAEEMGVSSPTVHNHLRKAENEVLGELLGEN